MRLLFKLLMRMGFMQLGPSVSSITSATQVEGTSLVHTVTLVSSVVGVPAQYTFTIGGSASAPSDYTATPTFSAGVTLSGGVLTVPLAVSSFTITVATSQDTVYEGTETYTVRVGSMTNTGTITDDESAPTVTSVSSASATEAAAIVHTVTITGTAQAAQTYSLTLSGGTATGGGTDYTSTLTSGAFSNGVTISGGTITVPAGVTSFTVSVPTSSDALVEGSETYTLSIGGASGTGTIIDEDAPAVAFSLVLSNPVGATISDGTGTATVTGGGGGVITPSIVEARSSGVAPLSVFFDASGTTAASLTSKPFHELVYVWSFGDTAGGATWTYGARAGLSKNAAFGPVASHVFETAGSYTVTLTVFHFDSGGTMSSASTTKSITVTAADTQWATTKTVCYSTNTDFTGAPSGCVQVSNVTDIGASIAANAGSGDKRHLLHAGQTFGSATGIWLEKAGPVMLGKFGSGANPIVNVAAGNAGVAFSGQSTPTLTDCRVVDIDLNGQSLSNNSAVSYDGGINQTLLLRLNAYDIGTGISAAFSTLDYHNANGHPGHTIFDQLAIVDSRVYNVSGGVLTGGKIGAYITAARFTFMGNNFDVANGGEHVLRTPYVGRGVVSNNYMARPASTKHCWQFHAPNQSGTGVVGGMYSEKVVVSDNTFAGGVTDWAIFVGPQNTGVDERIRDVIFERNFINAGTGTTSAFVSRGPVSELTFRNNIVNLSGSSAAGTHGINLGDQVTGPAANNLWFYANTFYSSLTVGFDAISIGTSATSVAAKNNLAYAPNVSAPVFLVDGGTNSPVVQNNSTDSAVKNTSPLFSSIPSTSATQLSSTDFKITAGSYAIDYGQYVAGVFRDFQDVVRTLPADIGAVQA